LEKVSNSCILYNFSSTQIDLELSSDNDMSYLEATPPHRFSDSEFEGQIEIMSITLDNVLKLGPKRTGSWNRSMSRDDIFTVDLHVEEVSDDNQNNDDEDQPETITSSSENEETVQLHAHDKTFTSSETETIMNERVGEVVRPLLSINGSRRLPPPPRPFRRHISLPASIFMNYLLAAEKNLTKNGVESGGNKKYPHQQQRVNRKKEGLNNRNNDSRCSSRRLLTKIDGSCSSSTESAEEQDNDFEDISHPDQDGVVVMTSGESASFDDSSSATNTPIYLNSSELDLAENRKEALSVEEGLDRDSPAFTSEIEKRSILLRYMRRLIRQDTSANFAPNDYCI
jgi:hypothetical protein